jgi:predicted HicB family RNase H-like nuclease
MEYAGYCLTNEVHMKLTSNIFIQVSPQLKAAIQHASNADGLAVNHWIAGKLANALKRPELAKIPRKRMGRPAKDKAV